MIVRFYRYSVKDGELEYWTISDTEKFVSFDG